MRFAAAFTRGSICVWLWPPSTPAGQHRCKGSSRYLLDERQPEHAAVVQLDERARLRVPPRDGRLKPRYAALELDFTGKRGRSMEELELTFASDFVDLP